MNSRDYISNAIQEAGKQLGIGNRMAFPKIEKIVINIGIGKDRGNEKVTSAAVSDSRKITGQKPVANFAKKAVSSFKVRKGEVVGYTVTLRNGRRDDFIHKLIKTVLPAIRDFKGLPLSSFDKQNNYSIGIKEYGVFPEISFGSQSASHGIQITIIMKSKNLEESKTLLEKLGFPFKKEGKDA